MKRSNFGKENVYFILEFDFTGSVGLIVQSCGSWLIMIMMAIITLTVRKYRENLG